MVPKSRLKAFFSLTVASDKWFEFYFHLVTIIIQVIIIHININRDVMMA